MPTKNPNSSRKFLEKLTGGPLTFGRAIRAIRLGDEQSLAQFSKLLGISASHLSDIELGRKTVSAERASKFAKRLQRSESQFVRLALQDLVSQAGLKFRVTLNSDHPKLLAQARKLRMTPSTLLSNLELDRLKSSGRS